ncbi:hypothetical protein ACJRO7_031689 [Eucalyptus globulus]|uniref:EF-hand domain-containing protein n=1 Tax=Eucalyptus globulus TaxID=34317 RepID=A0ABD3JI68_EUCGL
MAESLEEEKIFSGVGEEREKEALEALPTEPTEPTELSKPVLADIDIAEVREAASAHYKGLTDKPVLADIDITKVREAASAHYNGLTDDQKEEATRLFNTMDKNEDGDISVDEFKNFLSVAGLHTVNPDGLFAKLDKDGSKSLSFEELTTFFYVLSHDEYKHILERRPSTIAPGQEARIALGTAQGANDKGRKWNISYLSGLYNKFKGEYKLGEWVNENSCTILYGSSEHCRPVEDMESHFLSRKRRKFLCCVICVLCAVCCVLCAVCCVLEIKKHGEFLFPCSWLHSHPWFIS